MNSQKIYENRYKKNIVIYVETMVVATWMGGIEIWMVNMMP
ncbi:hypothetical protein [Siminovitchia fordii]|nr:hypothetical protein [Siminovitchia fordii]